MKKRYLFVNILFIFCLACRQNGKDVLVIRKSNQEAKIPYNDDDEKKLSYPGGMAVFYKYIRQHISYPKKAQAEKIEGKVIVQFIVEKDGTVSGIKVITSPSIDLSNECVRILKNMRFVPGTVDGKATRVSLVLPFVFQLNNTKKHF